MRVIDRHLGWTFLKGVALALLILVPLFSLGALVRELDDVGRGRYSFLEALIYVALTAPERALRLATVGTLLGGVFSLGALAAGGEIVAMRALGASVLRLSLALLKASLPLMLGILLVSEFVAPDLGRMARGRRKIAISEAPALWTGKGFWFRDGDTIVRVGRVRHGWIPEDVEIHVFGGNGRLVQHMAAASAEVLSDGRWVLHDVVRHVFSPTGVETARIDQTTLPMRFGGGELDLILLPPENLSLTDLRHQIRFRRLRGEMTEDYELAFWQKIARIFASGVMALLSLPFVLGPLRFSSLRRRMAVGAVTGVLAWLFDQLTGYLGLILNADPVLTAFLPVAVLLMLAVLGARRLS